MLRVNRGQVETKYDESLVNKAAFKLLQERRTLGMRQFPENKCGQALTNGALNGSSCFNYSAVPGVGWNGNVKHNF